MAWRVEYFCACRETKSVEVPETLGDDRCFRPLNSLYFCEDCGLIRCPNCVDKEVVSCFCSSCLFEVTQAAAVKNGNRCFRNCLRCPDCHANLILSSGETGYSAKCANCEFYYEYFQKDSPLGVQADNLARDQALQDARDAFASGKEVCGPSPGPPRRIPELAPLRARYSKHCKYCRNLMVDPDPRPGSAKLISATMARDMVPEILLTDTEGKSQLAVFNPSPLDVSVSFASSSDVRFLVPEVTLKPQAAKRDDVSLLRGVPEAMVVRETTASRRVYMEGSRKKLSGLERGANWALVDLEIPAETTKFTTQVSVKFTNGDENIALTLWVLFFRV